MGTKLNPGEFDCYANAEPDEPMFVLLGRDARAPELIRMWADERKNDIAHGMRPSEDAAQVIEAYACAAAMEAFNYRYRCRQKGEEFDPELAAEYDRAVANPYNPFTKQGVLLACQSAEEFNEDDED